VAGALAGDAALGLGTLWGGEDREIDLHELRGRNERSEGACRSRYGGLRKVRAACADSRRSRRLAHAHRAMVVAIAAAAYGQMRVGVLSHCKQRCDGRETEDCEQKQCEGTTHVVTSLAGSLGKLVFACLAFVFLVVIPSAASEPAVSRSLPCRHEYHAETQTFRLLSACTFLRCCEQKTGDSRFTRYARNDNKKGKYKCKGKSRSRFPAGMTTRKATTRKTNAIYGIGCRSAS
jgi:hypothetical protein